MTVHRPGDVLAGRYRLADLLSESEHGRFWLAHDSILGRPVAVHVLDADDARAPALMKAARISASIVDQRLLRVLDAETRDGISYVVNEWGRGTSLDILLTRSGPLSPRRAAWITSQVAATLEKAHALGHAHGRLNPENILIDDAGSVRIIGFAVEAALYGAPAGTPADDDTNLAAVLAAALTGTWSGQTPSSLPPTPLAGNHPMRPRQVRAGVPRQLDDLCEAALNPAARGRHEGPVLDAAYLHHQLAGYLGDPSDVAGLPAEQSRHAPGTVVTSLTLPSAAAATTAPEAVEETDAADEGDTGAPTEASLPSFEDDDSWHLPRVTPAPPPPPLEAPAPKPLFADEPRLPRAPEPGAGHAPMPSGTAIPPPAASDAPTGQVAATQASGVPDDEAGPATESIPAVAAPDAGAPSDYWPWSEQAEPPRRRRWLSLVVGLIVLLVVVAAVLVIRDLAGGGGGGDAGPTAGSSPTAAAGPISGLTATDFDPFGRPQSEYPEDAKYAVDGKPETHWQTSTYTDQLGPSAPALKSGVGLVIDLHRSYAVDTAHLTLNGNPTTVALYLSDTEPTSVSGLHRAATTTVDDNSATVALHGARGRYLVVWLTSLPRVSGGYRGEVAEVSVTGAAH